MDPSDAPLPAFLDPLLDYLSDQLPSPLYSFLLSFLSHTLALLSALLSLAQSLVASKPWEWDAQTIIPPLISVLAAYLALHSLYRTTSWMFRTAFWFAKWGTILAVVSAGMGWYMADQNAGGGDGRGNSLISSLGGVLTNILDGYGGPTNTRSSRSRTSKTTTRPKSWESFDKHRAWQYQEQQVREGPTDAQRIVSDIAATASRLLVEGGWWDAAKNVLAVNGDRAGGAERRKKRDSR
ncbi:hypothetical protein ID866_6483 [Astraeus odoratus]|nr:hypothetical protein ID866_6483 [Astraeus odoratus]